ncbi:MAG: hypothetical protein H3C58_04280 [Fimbriimonadaceae bacterium]|nr:hypothetical protein [Fimbriimonadaceae bacterium]
MLYALLCLAALNAQPNASPTYQDRVGVCVHLEHVRKGGLDRVKELGIGWIRTDLNWESVERRKGEFDFSAYDRLFADADRLGLKVLVILDYWHRFYDGPRMNTNVARRGFANYVAKALQRYKGRGFHWELWNEPNHPKFWHPKPDPDEYNALAREVQAVFADLAPGETLIGPALSHLDLDYLTALAPVLPKFAGVSFHPYRDGAPESIVPELDGLRQTLGHLTPQAPLVASEWGYSSARGRMTDDQHADHAMRTLLTGMVAGVQRTFWYDLMNDGDDPQEREHHFGLYKSDGNPKAAAKALAELGKSLRGHSYVGRFALASPQDFALLFAKADSYRWVAWTIRDRATQADLAVGVPEVRVVRPVQGASVKPSRSGRVSARGRRSWKSRGRATCSNVCRRSAPRPVTLWIPPRPRSRFGQSSPPSRGHGPRRPSRWKELGRHAPAATPSVCSGCWTRRCLPYTGPPPGRRPRSD